MRNKIIAVDFDGVLCENKYPDIGEPRKDVIARLIKEQQEGAKTILWTCRQGEELLAAIYWALDKGIAFDAVNDNVLETIEHFDGNPRKIFAHEYWDDRAVVFPLEEENVGFYCVDKWREMCDLKKLEAETTERIRKDVTSIIDRRLDLVESALSPDLAYIILGELNRVQMDISNYFGTVAANKPHEEREAKKKTKVYCDKNRDLFCFSCGFSLHRQRNEGNYCSGCGAALDWDNWEMEAE